MIVRAESELWKTFNIGRTRREKKNEIKDSTKTNKKKMKKEP